MEEKQEEGFSKRTTQLIALTALFLAICATFSSLKAGAFASKGILAQNQASDGWAHYQAKSLKQNTYQVQLDELELRTETADTEKFATLKKKYQERIDRYEAEQKEISAEAKEKEAQRDHFLELNRSFAGAVTLLQIAILLVSLAALVKQRPFWYIGMVIGVFGVYQFITSLMMV
ncbi:MAG: DUF4337 domain-containing protein [Selenomonadaceae bacterium]|jgi:hypothetical protein|nr:DUF4337 domain-containing protein [Selenomonadaceae bacterium]MBQ1510485.1 DUF4337 domain-containing protein [Selenomonadaceae bacterium]